PSVTRFPYTTLFRSTREQFHAIEKLGGRPGTRRGQRPDQHPVFPIAGNDAGCVRRKEGLLDRQRVLKCRPILFSFLEVPDPDGADRKSTRLNSSHVS